MGTAHQRRSYRPAATTRDGGRRQQPQHDREPGRLGGVVLRLADPLVPEPGRVARQPAHEQIDRAGFCPAVGPERADQFEVLEQHITVVATHAVERGPAQRAVVVTHVVTGDDDRFVSLGLLRHPDQLAVAAGAVVVVTAVDWLYNGVTT
jgi:hypothetical protein